MTLPVTLPETWKSTVPVASVMLRNADQVYPLPVPAFLLQPGELLQAFRSLTPVAFEQGYVERPKPAMIQRLCARRGGSGQVRIAP